jgi:glucan biosynthesis protein C
MEKAALDTNVTLTPPLRIIVAYSVFVVYGWLLYKRKVLIDKFSKHGLANLIIGFVFSLAYFMVLILVKVSADPVMQHLAGIVLCSFSMWFLIFGFIGVFVKYFDRPSPIGRYLSDASYWLYLIHLPIAVWLAGALSSLAISALLKFSIVLIFTALITLLTYHFFVRSTLVGWILNGKKYARSLPKFNDLGEYIPHNQPELIPVKTLNQTDLNT